MAKGYTVKISFKRGWLWPTAIALLVWERFGMWLLEHALNVEQV